MKSLKKCRKISLTLLSTSVAIVLVATGCSNSKYDAVLINSNDRVEITQAHSEFSDLAKSSNLPMEYVSEGKIGVSNVEAALETADATDLHAQAQRDKYLADFDARRSEVKAKIDQDLAQAQALREKYSNEYGKAMAQIAAREAELGAFAERKDTIIASLQKEGDSQCKAIIANANEKFASETARIDQIKQIYNAIEVESNAKILEMQESSKATRQRAAATVSQLDAQAEAIKLETQARASELQEQIRSNDVQTASEATKIRVTRESLVKDTEARVKQLRSKAATIEANLASHKYELMLAEAVATKTGSQAKTQESLSNAPTRFDRAMAEIQSLRGDVAHRKAASDARYESGMAKINAKLSDELNEVKKLRVNSNRLEDTAHAEFVKAQAASVANAVRETAVHAETVAKAKEMQIIAQAEAEAAKIKEELMAQIAQDKKSGRIEAVNHTTPEAPLNEVIHQVPATPVVAPVAPRMEPDHIASYKSSLAKVMSLRAKADAIEMVAKATFAEEKTKMLAVKTQEEAIITEKLAVADALEAQAQSRFDEIKAKLATDMDIVESQYRQDVVAAESFRKEKEAEVLDIQSQALALEQITKARAEKLSAEEASVLDCGANKKQELEVQLWAVNQKGDAEYSRLTSESKSVLESQEALALELDAQVASAQKHLKAELAKIENSINSSTQIAKADYQQSLSKATVLAKNIEAKINRTNAQFAMEHTVASTQIERDRQLALSQHMRSEAACDRMVANAKTNGLCENANLDALYAAADADLKTTLTANAAKRDAAAANLDAVKARFAARVEQVKAERVIDIADEHNALALKRTDLASALAQAVAARESSTRKLDALAKRQADLEEASMINWSAKLAKVKESGFEFETFDSAPDVRVAESTQTEPKAVLTKNTDF